MIVEALGEFIMSILVWVVDKLPALPSLDGLASTVAQGFPMADEITASFNTLRHFFVILNDFVDMRFVGLSVVIMFIAANAKLIVAMITWVWERIPFI